ncbi:MAG TPA: SDR family NAD(P)-dependent oxidoreductase [Actinophytocola sp.]|uniref:SDR family NAD(P)-dependent oxidoreductase n=1 Tax=Actinophytocola sp. TaxID=1872138 RepID=UPI002DDD940F|nr:SDR family NAD(P)-dependent oxidoreductase [Actinophytocola sp.]HEV2781133.1 SDR family NAD(P)-dependent oxidoreductase [Actinophytocola sp.]
MRRFAGKVAVITGAGSGIGRALSVELARRGARLALSDVDVVTLAETAALCEKEGAEVRHYELDVADRSAVLAHAGTVVGDFGGADLVVNNAGVALVAPVARMSWEDLEWVMSIDYWGVVHGTKAFLPHLIASGDGHLVTISSVFGLVGVPTQSAYNSAKFAVRGFTEALRQEMLLERHRVGVTCVHPGGIRTDIVRNARGADSGGLRDGFDRIARTTPERAAEIILRGVERNRPRVLVGADAYLIDALPRLLGPLYQRLIVAGVRIANRFGIGLGPY